MPELSPAFFFVLRKKLREGCTLTPTILFELRKKLREGCMLYFGNFVCNKKKDIFWRLFHKALPLDYRLRYIRLTETENCIWCSDKLQTIEYFALECPRSIIIWKKAYSFLNIDKEIAIPFLLDNIFQVATNTHSQALTALTWLHIITIYKIWY